MGTKGFFSFKYKDIYFTRYSYSDSYPSILGRRLVNDIPAEPEHFKAWIQSTRDHYEDEYQSLARVGDDHGYAYKPSPRVPENGICIEWVYVIDLDRMSFSVDNGAHFRLDNIPRGLIDNNTEWIEYLALDGRGWRCLKPSTPRQLVADLHPNSKLSAEGLELYEELKPKAISSGEWMNDASASGLGLRTMAVMVFRTLLNQYYGRLSDVYQYPPDHPKFRGPAEFLLRAAAPSFLTLSFDEPISSSTPAPDVGSTTTAPESGSIYYWFRGCLVRLSTRLDSDSYLRSAVGDAVLRVRRSSLETCTVLLWSMQHVAVVRVQGDQISHSAAIPILAAYGTDDSALDCGIRLLTYYLRPALTSFHGDVRSRKRMPRMSEMEHLVELAEGLNVKDRRAPGPSVPFDIVAEIMSYADTPTYNAFSRVSRASRVLWARRPRLGPYTILFVPPQLPSVVNDTRHRTSTSSGRFAAHDESRRPVRFRLSYHGRYPDDDKDTYTTRAARPENAKALVLVLPYGVRCDALMADLVNDVRHAIYITEEVDRQRNDESGDEDN